MMEQKRMERSTFSGEKRIPNSYSQKHTNAPSIEIGNDFNVRIDGVNEKEEGLARVKGCLLRIPYASKGELLKVKVKDIKLDRENNIYICICERFDELEPNTPLDNELP